MDKVQWHRWPIWWYNTLSWHVSIQMHHKQSVSIYQAALSLVGITSSKGEQEPRHRAMHGCSHDASRSLQVLHTLQSRAAVGSHCEGLGCRCFTRANDTQGRHSVQVPSVSNCCGCGTWCRPKAAGASHNANRGLWVKHTLQPWQTEASIHWIWHFSMQAVSQCQQLHQGWVKDEYRQPCLGVCTVQARVCGCCTRCSQVLQENTWHRHRLQVSYTVQAEAAGITREADIACGCQVASRCGRCCPRCRPSHVWHTHCRHGLRVAYQAVGSAHGAEMGCMCYTQCRQWHTVETCVAAMAASVTWWQKLQSILSQGIS